MNFLFVSSPANNLNRIVMKSGLGNAPKGQMAVAGEVWDDPPHACYRPGALWFGMTRHSCPAGVPPLFGEAVFFLQAVVACTDPPVHARLAVPPGMRSRHGEVWDDPPLRRAGQASGVCAGGSCLIGHQPGIVVCTDYHYTRQVRVGRPPLHWQYLAS